MAVLVTERKSTRAVVVFTVQKPTSIYGFLFPRPSSVMTVRHDFRVRIPERYTKVGYDGRRAGSTLSKTGFPCRTIFRIITTGSKQTTLIK